MRAGKEKAARREERPAAMLVAIASRVGRLAPDRRDPERFFLDKDEIAAELRRLARRLEIAA